MTEREKHIAQKKKELEKLCKQQIRLITKAVKLTIKPYKRQSTGLRRIGKSLEIYFQVRMIEAQKQMIIAQPLPSFVPGGVVAGGIAIVGEGEPKELIISPDGTITTANQHPHQNQLPPGPIRPVPGIDKESDV